MPPSETSNLPAIKKQRKTGKERFHVGEQSLPYSLQEFWQWSSSDLVGNALRGRLAEYIVATALDCADSVRTEWDAYDLLTPEGWKVEVKSGAFVQSWSQSSHSRIVFSIRSAKGWDAQLQRRSKDYCRPSNVYVFCVFACRDKEAADPLDLCQWSFYVLPTKTLSDRLGQQKSLSLSRLLALGPESPDYSGLRDAVRKAATLG